MSVRSMLRQRLKQREILLAPGAYDALTARLVEQAGFEAVYMSGAATAAAHGFPDYGLITPGEMIANAARMAEACPGIPVIADADTGYGNELNVTRAVRDYEREGVAAIHIEDQVSPKRCGHLDGKEVIPSEEFISKIGAAVSARRDPDFMVIARTDARAVGGYDDAISRAQAALRVGADMVFVEAIPTMEELKSVPQDVDGPCLLNVVPMGKTPYVTSEEAESMGYRMAILPGVLLQSIIPAVDSALEELKAQGIPRPVELTGGLAAAFRRYGASEWDALRRQFAEKA